MSKDRIDTRTSPFGGRDRLSPSQHMRLGNGLRCTGPTPEPQDETDGVPVIDWAAVHVIFYADKAHYAGLRVRVRAWRWYDKQRDGQSGASGVEVGRWVFDCDTVIALDPDLASLSRGADRIWQTRGAAKMYWQIVEVLNEDDLEPDSPPWIIVQPFGMARNDDPMAVALFDTHCDGDPLAYCCPDQAAIFPSAIATHWSPADGTATRTGATTLALAGFPFVVDSNNCQVLAVMVRRATGEVVQFVTGHDGVGLDAVANVVTITGGGPAPFLATDTDYWVYLVQQDKGSPVALEGVEATHWTPNDGTATYLSGTTLTLAGFPFVVDDANCRVLAVVVRQEIAGVAYTKTYIDGHNSVRITANAGVLSIGGAGTAPFAVTDTDYYVYIKEQEKAYDLSADAHRTEEIAPLNDEYTQPAYWIYEPIVTASAPVAWAYAPSVDGIIIDGYKDIAFQLYLLGGQTNAGVNRVLTVKFQGSNDADAGAGREWVDLGVGYDLYSDGTASTWVSTGLTALSTLVDFDNWMHKRIRVAYMWDDVPEADHPGAIVGTYRLKAL